MANSNQRDGSRAAVKKWARRGVTAVVVAGLAAGGLWMARPQPTTVETARVTEARLEATLDDEGRTRVRDRYVISATVGGNVRRPALHPGDAVEAGAVVAQILPADPAPLDARSRTEAEGRVRVAEAALRQAQSVVDRARGALGFARTESERVRRLSTAGALPAQDLALAEFQERSRADEAASAQFAARGAAYELDNARALLARATHAGTERDEIVLRSPVRAKVLRVLQASGGVVAAGTPLIELGDTEALEVVVDLLTADALQVAPGARVHLDAGGGLGPLEGQVRLVEPAAFTRVSALGVEEQRVNVLIELRDPPDRWRALGDGWRIEARIVAWEGARVLTLPLGALFRSGNEWCVYAVAEGRARRRVVSIGHQGGGAVEVTRGLRAGERIIVHPPDRLQEGERVAAQ
ncbi:MAG: HlyD family efflux transporter periplasmic adaptor subunit [Deltaproteobacteria bacterium]|nr:HlyD family efflux transporter periplasmic adaptor subunit [Myxococcales bacterium]MDP3220448.1 HlyD family efflux transporter periplasmic adaptor subunit [Deltaproteobacteria bacterium]